MKTYIVNNNTNEQAEIKLVQTTHDGAWWCDALTGSPIMKAETNAKLPEHISFVFDCSEDRLRIGQRLKQLREAKGISARNMEALTCIANQNISKSEKGNGQTVDTITRLASPLGYKLALVPIDFSVE